MATMIEWTEETWNPVTGCSVVSPGCAHCYAKRLAPKVFAGQWVNDGDPSKPRPRQFEDVRCHEDRLDQPLHWKRPRKVFVNSMSDLFHEDVPDEFISRVFAVMALAPQHTFQVLTKRPDRMRVVLNDETFRCEVEVWIEMMLYDEDRPKALAWDANNRRTDDAMGRAPDVVGDGWPLPNVWLGVSVENQHFADERIPLLLQTPSAVRFISYEPALGPVTIEPFLWDEDDRHDALCGLDWVIVGGESGPGARPFNVAWARSIVQQCQTAGVPVFVKQLGAWPYADWPDGAPFQPLQFRHTGRRKIAPFLSLHSPKGGDPLEWPEDLRVREFPHGPHP
jgi:protein gp37